MKKYLQKSIVIVATVVSVPCLISHADSRLPKPKDKAPGHKSPEQNASDPRFRLLKRFFHKKESPVEHLTDVFISEADANHLDWRLLPSLAMVESSAGKSFHGNNVFGWNNGDTAFPSVRESIHFVADRLAHGRFYRGKTVRQKLEAYNGAEGYQERVETVMKQISSPSTSN